MCKGFRVFFFFSFPGYATDKKRKLQKFLLWNTKQKSDCLLQTKDTKPLTPFKCQEELSGLMDIHVN